ncbi:GntR family transcriptional regulator [Variovorax sp. PCZ-1]|uniref:GntR family transcriptional regulator n=1 Tax=Variovorax sp. PCZ-1 TaxID=2835533 RepID=UPI001BCE3EAF|nr:GntR family transcriptional regulator [Variovorax sp. PCZ-1]MBS7807472.1 GntR family transcriptional regulator [Variovorax sp. PCZ-1]
MTALRHSNKDMESLPLAEQAYQEIRSRILDNLWTPGYQALEQEVALALGMSRTPVREALMRLQQEGLVEVAPRRGMRVLPVSPTDMREIYEILTALECMAAEILGKRKPSQQELKPLVEATQLMEAALVREDLDAWAKADETFHLALVKLAGNRMLLETVMGYWDRAHRARMFTLRLRPKPVNSTKEHMQLVDMLAAGDGAGAAQVNRSHRERASRELLAIFERYQLQQL